MTPQKCARISAYTFGACHFLRELFELSILWLQRSEILIKRFITKYAQALNFFSRPPFRDSWVYLDHSEVLRMLQKVHIFKSLKGHSENQLFNIVFCIAAAGEDARMNNIPSRAVEIIDVELICV